MRSRYIAIVSPVRPDPARQAPITAAGDALLSAIPVTPYTDRAHITVVDVDDRLAPEPPSRPGSSPIAQRPGAARRGGL
ncbi:MAG: hypothetical protein ACJ735_05360 [Actinomycetes bacterium]